MTLAAFSTRLPHGLALPPEKLAALGPLLCLHASCDPHLLSGWTRAIASFAWATLDTHGPCEGICFVDADGACCWQLQRLPDSDFLGWDRLLASLPSAQPATGKRSAWTRHWPTCAPARWRTSRARAGCGTATTTSSRRSRHSGTRRFAPAEPFAPPRPGVGSPITLVML